MHITMSESFLIKKNRIQNEIDRIRIRKGDDDDDDDRRKIHLRIHCKIRKESLQRKRNKQKWIRRLGLKRFLMSRLFNDK